MLFGRVLVKFGIDFALIFGPKIDEKSTKIDEKRWEQSNGAVSNLDTILGRQNRLKSRFGRHLGSQKGAKWVKKSIQKAPRREPGGTKTQSSIPKTAWDPPRTDLSCYPDAAGADFGAQNRSKSVKKWRPKPIICLMLF